MKMIILSAACALSSTAFAEVSLRAGMASLSCSNKTYTVSAYTDEYGTVGTAIVTQKGKIIHMTALVKSGGNGRQVVAAGLEFALSVDADKNLRGSVEYDTGERTKRIRFSDFQCSEIPSSWPNPGQI